jgi:hypothetical protein
LSFLHAGLLFGALLFTVPLLIHLLNRQRYRRRPWAAMEFLLLAYRKQRRRVRMENLLLLLLRCLIPIAIAFAIARPILRDAGIVGIAGSAHHVLVLDRSYSMGVQPSGGQSPFERARHLAAQLLERIDAQAGHKVTVVLAGQRVTLPVREDLSLARARSEVLALSGPEDTGGDLVPALQQVADLVDDAGDADLRVYLFTDLQQRAFGEAAGPGAGREAAAPPATRPAAEAEAERTRLFEDDAREAIQRIQKRARLEVIHAGAGAARLDNVQLTDLRLNEVYAAARVPAAITAHARNLGDTLREVQVLLEVDGGEPLRKPLRLDPGGEGAVEFQIVLREPGQRRLRAALQNDNLAADDERFLVANVRDRLRILLVEGSSESETVLQESGLLRSVLDPTGGEGAPMLTVFAPSTIDAIALLAGRANLAAYDLIVLANVERLNAAAAQALTDAVRSGVGLLVMFGQGVDPDSWNLHLHGGGDGLLPMRIGAPTGFTPGGADSYGSLLLRPQHPVVAELHREVFELTPIWRYVPVPTGTLRKDAEVVAALRDPEQSPLLVAADAGAGRTLWLTSAVSSRPDKANALDFPATAFPLFHEAVKWLALPSRDDFNVETGAPLATALRARPDDVQVVLPERAGGAKRPVGEESQRLPGGLFSLPPFLRTEYAGFYGVEALLEQDGGTRPAQLAFAVNVPIAEGELKYLPRDVAKERLGIERLFDSLPSEADSAQSELSELGIPLLWLALAFVLGEAALAHFVQRRRA